MLRKLVAAFLVLVVLVAIVVGILLVVLVLVSAFVLFVLENVLLVLLVLVDPTPAPALLLLLRRRGGAAVRRRRAERVVRILDDAERDGLAEPAQRLDAQVELGADVPPRARLLSENRRELSEGREPTLCPYLGNLSYKGAGT